MQKGLWFELVFKHHITNLSDLVSIKRVCKDFYSLKYLNDLIKKKEQIAFGSIGRQYWNKCASIEISYEKEDSFIRWHPDKFILYIVISSRFGNDVKKKLAVYHCKQDLCKNASYIIRKFEQNIESFGVWKPIWKGFKYCFPINSGFIYVQGCDEIALNDDE
jgi:hypothetical protein